MKLLLVGLGGALGAVSRYALSGLVYRWFGHTGFPYGTLAVNIIGCLLIGFLGGLAETRQFITPEFRLLVFIGFLGSFTTFSTFGFDVFNLMQDGQHFLSLLNIGLHLFLGISFVWLGLSISKLI